MRVRAIICAVLLVLMLDVVPTVPAHAHAVLVSSTPKDGAVVPTAPPRVVLVFNEPVSPLVVRLLGPNDASAIALDAAAENATSLAVALPTGLPNGTHVLSWRVVSLDGHPVGGTVVFSVEAPTARPDPAAADTGDPAVSAALWMLKILLYGGVFVGVGGSFFLSWLTFDISTGGGRAVLIASLWAGICAAACLVGLQGADALGVSLLSLAKGITWRTGLETSFGATAIAAAVALFLGLSALNAKAEGAARALSLLGMLAAGLALALSGHASAAAPQWLTRPAVLVHTISVAFWVGALVPLAAILARQEQPRAALARFSNAIPWALGALVVSGALLAAVQVAHPRALLATKYGWILCAKLGLVALLLSLAGWNRFVLTPGAMRGASAPRAQLARAIIFEIAIVFAIFGLVAMWRFTPPPRALALAYDKPALVHIHASNGMADVTFDPGRAGNVRARIAVMTANFDTLDAKEVRLTLENASMGIEAISRAATKGKDGNWHVEHLPIPAGGRWNVRVDILIDDFEKLTLEDGIDIGGR